MTRHERTARPLDASHNRAARRAFTLTELVVAVGAAAILTASVGVLFRSVGDLASSGVAATELDQIARVIERQMRDDIAAFNRLPSDETFLAIRFREIGDIDRDGIISSDERTVYLRPEDREADLARFPTAPDSQRPYLGDGVTRGRGVTTRLDEMIFLGKGTFVSAQGAGAVSSHARIAWGHGLRPLPDPSPDFDVNPTTGLTPAARRLYVPDGDFGVRAGEDFSFPRGFGLDEYTSTGRNEYAVNWPLTRQAMLLYGGSGAGQFLPLRQGSQTLDGLLVAPYIRNQELAIPLRISAWNSLPVVGFGVLPVAGFGQAPVAQIDGVFSVRLPGSGRSDIALQSLQDVRAWLEGDASASGESVAAAFSSGGWVSVPDDPSSAVTDLISGALWARDTSGSPAAREENLLRLQAAIAGAFSRLLTDDAPPQVIPRRFDPNATGADFREPAEAALMDLHALIASRCSRFEIAWNDGTVAINNIDVNSDGFDDYRAGDRIWFDISAIDDNSGNFIRRNTYSEWISAPGIFTDVRFARLNADIPEILNNDRLGATTQSGPSFVNDPILILQGFDSIPLYIPRFNGGSVIGQNLNSGPEAYAIWGFRTPLVNGGYGNAWPKPTLLRVRMTLHDSQLRSPEGKTYEFVFSLNNAR